MEDIEIWLPIKDYEGLYEISNLGRVKSLERYVTYSNGRIHLYEEKIMKSRLNEYGYYRIGLNINRKQKQCIIHRLIAIHFIPKIEGKNVINHKNGIKTDNRIENLEWVTARENTCHYHNSTNKSSQYTGVSFNNFRGKNWRAQITINQKTISLGYFDTELAASEAYQAALTQYQITNKYSN